jgi:hypothetical protein
MSLSAYQEIATLQFPSLSADAKSRLIDALGAPSEAPLVAILTEFEANTIQQATLRVVYRGIYPSISRVHDAKSSTGIHALDDTTSSPTPEGLVSSFKTLNICMIFPPSIPFISFMLIPS